MAVEMKRVMSSHIFEVGYDVDGKTLVVRYAPELKWPAGRVVEYLGVPEEVAAEVLSAPSIGSAMHSLVRGRYDYRG